MTRTVRTRRWIAAAGILLAVSAIGAAAVRAQQQRGTPPRLSAEDILEIRELGARYAYGLDTAADNGHYYANVFTVDGAFHGAAGATVGREKLAALAREGGGRIKLKGYQHVISNEIIEPTREGATGRQLVQVLLVGGPGKPPAIDHGGFYEDVYVKTSEGWRIKSRRYVQTFPPA